MRQDRMIKGHNSVVGLVRQSSGLMSIMETKNGFTNRSNNCPPDKPVLGTQAPPLNPASVRKPSKAVQSPRPGCGSPDAQAGKTRAEPIAPAGRPGIGNGTRSSVMGDSEKKPCALSGSAPLCEAAQTCVRMTNSRGWLKNAGHRPAGALSKKSPG